MATLGVDCTITLMHADVNGGLPYGFILDVAKNAYGQPVSIQRTVDSEGNATIKVFFNVLMVDDLRNPDGTIHADNRLTMYAMLTQYIEKLDGLTMDTPVGVFSNMGATGHSATEVHYATVSIVACQLNNTGAWFPPADSDLYAQSVWRDDADTDPEGSAWSEVGNEEFTGYWREG